MLSTGTFWLLFVIVTSPRGIKKKQCLSRYIHTVILVALACHKPAAMLDKILFYFDSRHTFTIIVATKIQIHEDVHLTHSQGRDMVSHTNK